MLNNGECSVEKGGCRVQNVECREQVGGRQKAGQKNAYGTSLWVEGMCHNERMKGAGRWGIPGTKDMYHVQAALSDMREQDSLCIRKQHVPGMILFKPCL